MSNPFFTIHIPVYNVEKYLSRCIDSVLNQTFQNFEIILTDDGSTDTSGNICDNYAGKSSKIKVFHNKNQGLLLTRRFSIKHATGEYSLFLDSDDFIEPFTLEHINSIIEYYECDTVVFHYIRISDKGEYQYKPPIWDKLKCFSNDKNELYEKMMFSNKLNNMCMKAVKTALLLTDNINYEIYSHITNSEDLLQSFHIIFNSAKVVYTPTILYNYFTNTSSMSFNINKRSFESRASVRKVGLNFLESMPDFCNETKEKYATFCAKSFFDNIKAYVVYSPDENKADTLKYIKELDFYKNFIFKYPIYSKLNFQNKIIYYLLKNDYYSILFLCIKLCAKIKNINTLS